MVGVPSSGLGQSTAAILADSQVGSVILLENSQAGSAYIARLTRQVREAAGAPKGVRTLLAADQEGGLVQRLQGRGFDRIPSASAQAYVSDQALRSRATIWGRQLKRAGIDANLAPVADVVPSSLVNLNAPIGQLHRGFGPDPAVVADKVRAVVGGMGTADVATAVKHFPGLGRVRGNTDLVARVVDSTTTRHDAALKGFSAGVGAGVDMVMVSSAFYTKIDPVRRAAYSTVVISGMLRGDLGFRGVVISDDLAAVGVRELTPGERALRFLQAGGDLVIVGTPTELPNMVSAVKARAAKDKNFASLVEQKAQRVISMKARRGLASC
jgi:beta-N-acetylhexosaminidase